MEFVGIGSVDATALRWIRVGDRPLQFVLSTADAPLAQLQWQKDGGSLAVASALGAVWELKRSGFLNPQITARRAGDPRTLARLSVHLNHHSIEIAGGLSFRFHRAGVLLPAWQVTGPDGQEVLHVEPVREGRALAGGAVLAPAPATHGPQFLLLAVLAWYFIALAWFEDETVIPFEGPALSVAQQP